MNFKETRKQLLYFVYPTSFFDSNNDGIGDLNGIKEKLDYIADLGFNAIWISPCFLSPFKDGGYDVVDYYKIDPKFGDLNDLDELLKKAHKLNIKVYLDLVCGHMSEDSYEFQQSAKPEKNEYSDLFIWTNDIWKETTDLKILPGKYTRNGAFAINWFVSQPAINYGFYDVRDPDWQMSYKDPRILKNREFILNVMRFYLSRGVDGFRVDMAGSIVKNDPEAIGTIETWNYMFGIIRKEFPNAFFLSEWDRMKWSAPAGFDSDFEWGSAIHLKELIEKGVPTPEAVTEWINLIKEKLEIADKYKSTLSFISSTHDQTRITSNIPSEILKAFYIFMFGMPGSFIMYYGDEIEMEYYPSLPTKDGGYNRTGSRTPFQWDNSKNCGFSQADELYLPVKNDGKTLENAKKNPESIYNLIKKLAKLRLETEDLLYGDWSIDSTNGVVRVSRGKLEVIFNLTAETIDVSNVIISSSKIEGKLPKYQSCIRVK